MEEWILIAIMAILIIQCGVVINASFAFHKFLSEESAHKENEKRNFDNIKYSQDVLDFTKRFTVETSVFETKSFFDSHKIDKLTKAQIQGLVRKVSMEVNNSQIINNFDYEKTVFSRQYIEKYVIEISIMTIKDLLEKEIKEMEV